MSLNSSYELQAPHFLNQKKCCAALFLALQHYCFPVMLAQALILYIFTFKNTKPLSILQYVQIMKCIKEK